MSWSGPSRHPDRRRRLRAPVRLLRRLPVAPRRAAAAGRQRDQPGRARLHLREVHQPEADGRLLHQGGHHRLHRPQHPHPLPVQRRREEVRHRLSARQRRLAAAARRSRPLHLSPPSATRASTLAALPLPPAVVEGIERHYQAQGLERADDSGVRLAHGNLARSTSPAGSAVRNCEQKLQAGEIHAINDLITYNLDICQFAQDVIENCEGPELLRAFYQAIAKRVRARPDLRLGRVPVRRAQHPGAALRSLPGPHAGVPGRPGSAPQKHHPDEVRRLPQDAGGSRPASQPPLLHPQVDHRQQPLRRGHHGGGRGNLQAPALPQAGRPGGSGQARSSRCPTSTSTSAPATRSSASRPWTK